MSPLILSSLILALLCGLSLPEISLALQKDTWKDVSPSTVSGFPRKAIGCGYFWDKDHGLIGSGVRPETYPTFDNGFVLYHPIPGTPVSIYYTTDGGASWGEAKVPVKIGGAVTKIWMVDTLEGYASIVSDVDYASYFSFGASGLWKTTDGGRTWFDPFHLDHDITSVYAQKGLLIYTHWDSYYTNFWLYPRSFPSDTSGGHYSFDDGATWQTNFRRGNDIAFSDNLNGVVSEMNGGDNRGWNFWVTVDGGHTWDSTTKMYEAWSVYAVPGERTYYTACESQPGRLPYTTIYRSTDAGYVWKELYTFDSSLDMRFSGTIAGKGSTLYIQTDTEYSAKHLLGMYRSDDKGLTWRWVGGPANSRDSRFVVTGCSGEVVYAFDAHGGVWKTTDGGDGTLDGGNPNDAQFTAEGSEFTLRPQPCIDSMQFEVYSTSCTPVTVDSVVQISGSDLVDRTPSLPTKLFEGDSLSVKLGYEPLTDTSSTSVVRVYAHAGSRKITQDVRYDLIKQVQSAMILSPSSLNITTSGCAAAVDSLYIGMVGCPGMILDSIEVDGSELHVLNVLPDTIGALRTDIVRFFFAPDSSGTHEYHVHLRGHLSRRVLDTTIIVSATAVRAPEYYVLGDSQIEFVTKYCETATDSVLLTSTSCDSVTIDSVILTSGVFVVGSSPEALPSRTLSHLAFNYLPGHIGSDTAVAHIYGHSRFNAFDTTLTLFGTTLGNSNALELSDSTLDLVTTGCAPEQSTLRLTNQGCTSFTIDSVYATGGEFSVQLDTTKPLGSNDTLPIVVTFAPDSGGSRSAMLRVRAHDGLRVIDTLVPLTGTNNLPASPLQFSSDTVYLLTKYCHSIDDTLSLENVCCPGMTIDSIVMTNDLRSEFSVIDKPARIGSVSTASVTVRFDPDTSGRRTAQMRIYGHLGDTGFDTVLTLIGHNITAPEPYLRSSDSGFAGTKVATPLFIRSTTDPFAIHSLSAHFAFNTDILTPTSLAFDSTCSPAVLTSALTGDPSGATIDITYVDSLRDTANLNLPVVKMISAVSLTKDLNTPVLLDRFSTDVEPTMTLCSVPVSEFVTLLQCADPIIVDYLRTGAAHLTIVSVQPNPISTDNEWKIGLHAESASDGVLLELYGTDGTRIERQDIGKVASGSHVSMLQAPAQNGDYFLVVRSVSGIEHVQKVTVIR